MREIFFDGRKATKRVMGYINEAKKKRIIDNCAPRDKARLTAAGDKYANQFHNILPDKVLGMFIPNQEFQDFFRMKFGFNVYSVHAKQCNSCKKEQDPYGDHALSCTFGGQSIQRHDIIAATITAIANDAGIPAKKGAKEDKTNSSKNPSDLIFIQDENGNQVDIDVTIRSVTTNSCLRIVNPSSGMVTAKAEKDKHTKYKRIL